MKHKKTLVLFFSFGVSVSDWVERGLLDREKLLYETHLKSGVLDDVLWFTYGAHDKQYEHLLHKHITIIPLPYIFASRIGHIIYSLIMPLMYWRTLRRACILKTNQFSGSWTAALSTLITRTPLIVRSGYIWSIFAKRQHKPFWKRQLIALVEKMATKIAHKIIVASAGDADYLERTYGINREEIHILHNYVDTSRFYNMHRPREERLVFIGRLHEQKNLQALLHAVTQARIPLDVYGSGPQKAELRRLATDEEIDVTFHQPVANMCLPEILNRARYFVLPSLYEGTPKALIEAMGCGCVCIGTNVEGINSILVDMHNGVLATSTTAPDLAVAINRARNVDHHYLVRRAEHLIYTDYSLIMVAQSESTLLKSLIKT